VFTTQHVCAYTSGVSPRNISSSGDLLHTVSSVAAECFAKQQPRRLYSSVTQHAGAKVFGAPTRPAYISLVLWY
jgi:hypothetical protein